MGVAIMDERWTLKRIGAYSGRDGHVGYADWRDGSPMGTRTYCGHGHPAEADALQCVRGLLAAHEHGEHNAKPDRWCGRCQAGAGQ